MRPVHLMSLGSVFALGLALGLHASGPQAETQARPPEPHTVIDYTLAPAPIRGALLQSWRRDVINRLAAPTDENPGFGDTLGVQRTVVILVSIRDKSVPIDRATAQRLVFQDMNNFWRSNSFGKMTVEGTVVGPFLVSSSVSSRDALRDRAIEAADPTVDFRQYSRIIIFSPWDGAIQATIGKVAISTGDGTVTASVSYDNLANPIPDYETLWNAVTHEFGHNLGFGHTFSMDCLTCNVGETDDPFDIMAGASRHTNAFHKGQAGWLDNTVTASEGQYVLGPLEVRGTHPQQIRVPLSSDDYYSLEFRQPLDYDEGLPPETYSSVVVYLVRRGALIGGKREADKSILVNYRKQGKNDKMPLLQVGHPFRDARSNISITLESVDSEGAHLRISGGSPSATSGTSSQPGASGLPRSGSCENNCGKRDNACSCDESCAARGDCCRDYDQHCSAGAGSRSGSGGSGPTQIPKNPSPGPSGGEPAAIPKEPSPESPTSDPTERPRASSPGSCQGTCGGRAGSCWCDVACSRAGDCCADYRRSCAPPF